VERYRTIPLRRDLLGLEVGVNREDVDEEDVGGIERGSDFEVRIDSGEVGNRIGKNKGLVVDCEGSREGEGNKVGILTKDSNWTKLGDKVVGNSGVAAVERNKVIRLKEVEIEIEVEVEVR